MKRIMACLKVTLMIFGINVFAVLRGDTHHTRRIHISEPMIIGGAIVKEGEYKMRFDEAPGDLTVMKMNGDMVASALGQVVQLDDDADVTALTTTDTEAGRVLTAV